MGHGPRRHRELHGGLRRAGGRRECDWPGPAHGSELPGPAHCRVGFRLRRGRKRLAAGAAVLERLLRGRQRHRKRPGQAGADRRPLEGAGVRDAPGRRLHLHGGPEPVKMRRHQDRGFTLIELLVAGIIATAAMTAVTATFILQQRSILSLDLARVASDAGRDALLEMEASLRRLGWGIDPRFAIDLRSYSCDAVPCRDRIDAPDEIVFVSRNPNYRWVDNGTAGCATAGGCFTGNGWHASLVNTTVTTTARASDTFTYGRLLLITCVNGTRATMARVAQTKTAAAAGSLDVPVMAA